MSAPPSTHTYYHAGPLFTLAELHNNVILSNRIHALSSNKFIPLLPQNIEQREGATPHSIRDDDIRALLSCDLALFTFDGAELDAGTVVEYMIAKFADIPTVVLRTDFRAAGDQGETGERWNLMCSFWPRSVPVVVDSMGAYKGALKGVSGQEVSVDGRVSARAGEALVEATAMKVVEAMEKVLTMPARLPKELRESVYKWIAMMPGFKDSLSAEGDMQAMLKILAGKEEKGMFVET